MPSTILVVDDSQLERLLIEALLVKNPRYRVMLAENGREALTMLARNAIDLVVTDLVMPEMNGVDLVRQARRSHSDVPVILMTAYGDESTAIEALEAGAASYVPKSQQAERLLETVDRVIEHAAANRIRGRLGRCMLEYNCRFALDNDLGLIRSLVDQIQQVMAAIEFGDSIDRIRIGEAIEEGLLNAMYHGNLEIEQSEWERVRNELDERLLARVIEERCRDPRIADRKIIVVVRVTSVEARFVIRDQGRGFAATPASGSRAPEAFGRGSHRGLTLIHSLMDEVSYNAAGNELTIRKCLPTAAREIGSVTQHS